MLAHFAETRGDVIADRFHLVFEFDQNQGRLFHLSGYALEKLVSFRIIILDDGIVSRPKFRLSSVASLLHIFDLFLKSQN